MGPCCATNPITSLVQLRWSSQISSITPSPNDAVDTYPNPYISIYASCSIEVVNATLRYEGTAEGKEWRLVTEKTIRSEERFASTLIAPYTFQLVTDRLSANIRARAMLATTVDEVMSALNQELSRLALGFVSGGFEFSPALDVQHVTPTILGRYPLVPLLAFVGLLCFYGAIALTFCVLSSKASSASVIISAELRGKSEKKVIMVLELAKTRLSSPLPIVAQLFSSSPDPQTEPRTHNSDALSVKTLGLDLFSEGNAHSIGEVRLRLGLEDGSMRPRYGTWKKD
ncbi:hypothetical protein BDV93DRAFT_612292 [Ceratobasidium sp. AG-I]|nr:hypothetical protein BDV93DRAFT_612292 [Ceratobasidium sp. AG-I]